MSKPSRIFSLLQALSVTCSIVSPILSGKLITLSFIMFDTPVEIPASVFVYAFIFLISNVISEVWSDKFALVTTFNGFVCQLFASVIFFILILLPCSDPNVKSAYSTVFSSNFFFTLSGIIAYICSQRLNIFLYKNLRRQGVSPAVVNLASTLPGQAVDAVVFLGLSYGVFLKYFADKDHTTSLIIMLIFQYLIRILITLFELPIFKLIISKVKDD